ncbi:MAG: hypothetical protein IJF40_00660 [Clostridia bacterium]|nr:hypothetical protein [Clostridia bacterium]
MKQLKRTLALILSMLIVFSGFGISASAEETSKTITVKMMNYNVAGMPKFDGTDVAANQQTIAKYIVDNNFDIVATQEDFGYHRKLVKGLNGFNYFTNHSGSIPGGDGMNVFTKTMPIYNEERYPWDESYGTIEEGDTLTPKGLMHVVIEIADGVYIDFYNLHADAFGSDGSIAARESNYKQTVDLIEENYKKYNRPVIVTGDFNHFHHTNAHENSNMYAIFQERCGLKDAWIEVHNDGDYFNFSKWYSLGGYWGVWDSVEKFMYKDGGGITLEPVDYKYTWIKNETGANTSDHAAAECTFTFTVTEDFVENTQELKVVNQFFLRNFFNMIKWIFKDLIYIFSNFDELIEFLG